MTKARLASILSVAMVVVALAAAILNYVNNGQVTWKAVAGLLFFVSMALVIRGVTAAGGRGTGQPDRPKTS